MYLIRDAYIIDIGNYNNSNNMNFNCNTCKSNEIKTNNNNYITDILLSSSPISNEIIADGIYTNYIGYNGENSNMDIISIASVINSHLSFIIYICIRTMDTMGKNCKTIY